MYNEVHWEFLQLLQKQEIYWKQRAKQFWLKVGDQNTQSFHKYASQGRKTNLIERIKDNSGQWCENLEDIQKVIEKYFSELFTTSSANGQLSQREEIKRVSKQENADLVSPVTEEEVKHDVFSMHPDKSPGLDEFNPVFYQFFLEYSEERCGSAVPKLFMYKGVAGRDEQNISMPHTKN